MSYAALPAVQSASQAGDQAELKTTRVSQTVIELVRLIEARNNELVDLHIHHPSLEDVFIELTGKGLRD